jgi:two-component system, cell cycle sensor histidine kinase and response regulator CckA
MTSLSATLVHDIDEIDLHGHTILLIDDEPLNFIILRELLKEYGLALSHALNGTVGIQSAQELMPSLIFLDVMMPGMDGFETCRCLKAHPVTTHIPVIFITALDDLKSKITGFESGGVDYISKPFQREEVIKRLNLHLRLSLTQQRLAEKVAESARLEQELQKFYRAFEQAPLPICITDIDKRIEFANDAFLTTCGYQRFEVLGNTPALLHSHLNPPQIYQQLWATLDSGQSWHGQLINRKKNGHLYWECVNIAPLFAIDGQKVGYMAIKKDISLYKEYEDRLHTYEEKFNFYSEQTLFAYIEWDPEFLLVAWNKGAAHIFGYDAEDALGQNGFQLLFLAHDQARIASQWGTVNEGNNSIEDEIFEHRTKANTLIRCLWHNTVLRDHNNAVTAIVSLVQRI